MCFGRPLQRCGACTLNKITPSFRTRRYFSHHSNRGNSLQDYSSFAGETFGTHIDKYRPLIMPLVRRQKRTTPVGSLVLIVELDARYGRRLAPPASNKHIAFISVFFFLYKSLGACTLNKITPSFRTRRYFSHHSNRGNSLQE